MNGSTNAAASRPLIAHVLHRFDVGGMENGVVNLLNELPVDFAEHCVVALTEVSPEFRQRVRTPGVRFVELRKPPGQTARILPRLWRLFRAMRPAIVHTRNVATLEAQLAAWAAGVPVRIHGEHGWDVGDLDGTNTRMLWLRRAMRPFVHHQVALSNNTERYLVDRVHVARMQVTNICNGVDTDRFRPAEDRTALRRALLPAWPDETFVIGAVGRFAAVKNLGMLLDGFAAARQDPEFAARARLVLVGDGPELAALSGRVSELGLDSSIWMTGSRDDVPQCLQALDLLCLTSLAEGISNTILEAMATGIPVVATDVGGNPDLVTHAVTGTLVPSRDSARLAEVLADYVRDAAMRIRHGRAARVQAVTQFSLQAMVARYHRLYLDQLRRAGLDRVANPAAAGPTDNPRAS